MFQYISHYTPSIGYVDGIRMALEGGCKWVQLRMKDAPEEEVLACAKEALPLCRQHGAKFILDDHVELVETVGADGVHLGKNDMPVDEARKILGPDKSSEVQPIPLTISSVFTVRVPIISVAVRSDSPPPRKNCRRYSGWKDTGTLS